MRIAHWFMVFRVHYDLRDPEVLLCANVTLSSPCTHPRMMSKQGLLHPKTRYDIRFKVFIAYGYSGWFTGYRLPK